MNGQVSGKENQLLQILWRYTPRATLFRLQLTSLAVRITHISETHPSMPILPVSHSVCRVMCKLDV